MAPKCENCAGWLFLHLSCLHSGVSGAGDDFRPLRTDSYGSRAVEDYSFDRYVDSQGLSQGETRVILLEYRALLTISASFDTLLTSLVDTHNDFPSFIRAVYGNDIYQDNFTSDAEMPLHVDFPRLREGGLGAQFWSAFVEWFVSDRLYPSDKGDD